jgi:hypothetical protein
MPINSEPLKKNPYRLDLTGKTFAKLTVVGHVKKVGTHQYWKCICECGEIKDIQGNSLKSGKTTSCGCYQKSIARDLISRNRPKKRDTDKGFNSRWRDMIRRCYDEKVKSFPAYGGRGIRVCDRWKDFKSFENDMYSSYVTHRGIHGTFNTTIERINVNGNYEPENCRWATRKEQNNNQQSTIRVTISGVVKTLNELSSEIGISKNGIKYRLNCGLSDDEILKPSARKKIYHEHVDEWREEENRVCYERDRYRRRRWIDPRDPDYIEPEETEE